MYLQHITSEGERWDSIAYRYYGDALAYEGIIAANPALPITAHLSAGQVLLIPVIAPADTVTEDIPPWLR